MKSKFAMKWAVSGLLAWAIALPRNALAAARFAACSASERPSRMTEGP